MTTRELAIGGNTLRFETGKLAKQAGGAVVVRFGDSVVLVTACRSANKGISPPLSLLTAYMNVGYPVPVGYL